jgi:hypothetical protein
VQRSIHGECPATAQVENHQVTFLGPISLQRLASEECDEIVQQERGLADAEHAELWQLVPFETGTVAGGEDSIVADGLEGRRCSQSSLGIQWQPEALQEGRRPKSRGQNDNLGRKTPAVDQGNRLPLDSVNISRSRNRNSVAAERACQLP